MNLVGRQADAHAGAADEDATVDLAVGHEPGHAVAAHGVVEALGAVGAHVNELDVAPLLEVLHHLGLDRKRRVVVPNGKTHDSP